MAEDAAIAEALQCLRLDPAQLAKEQARSFDGKKNVWVATTDIEGYLAAEIESTSGEMVTVMTEKGQTMELKKEDCDQMNPPKYEKCSDMSTLTHLNEATILYNLKARFVAGLIYTYSGLFCIAVNPYKRLPIYTDTVVKMYRGKRKIEMPPHVFSLVDNAYQDMLQNHDNQSMLITGESGAGKTVNTKKVIQYIAKVAGVEKPKDKPAEPAPESGGGGLKGGLDEQVVEANPLLEAFGNAKTTRNNNSSRFGKFIRCHFSQNGKLAGADIESYLLEKNRVTDQGCEERNYHIFYQLIYASTDEELGSLCLISREAKDYGYLQKGVPHVDAIDDHEEYGLTLNAVKVLGFTDDEKNSMFKICAGILNFSNMKFKQKPRDEQAEVDDPADGERVSYLLGLPCGEFCKSLTKPKVKVGTEYVNKGQNITQVNFAIAAMVKALFERMFLWMVIRVNKALETKERRAFFVGVLDIAGFEIFEYNSFDQLCINVTNEKLQQFFNHHMFVVEQEEYKKEGIVWEFVNFGMDLDETINLIEKPMGIFAMLEEECIVPKATHETFLAKLHKQHAGKSKSYTKPTAKQNKAGGGDFILSHYAGKVGYSVAGWLEKNKDPLTEHTAQLFSKATDPLVSHLFQDYNPDLAGGRRKGSAFQTVSNRHKEQLKNLLDTLGKTSPHFVRCIIPNEQKQPGLIEGQLVLHQLRCNGVLEGIRICRLGFPSKMLFTDFRQRYEILAAAAIPSGFVDGKVAVQKLLEALQLGENEFRVGNTKIFFRSGIIGELEEMRDERLSKIISQFQAYCKGHLMRIEYKKMYDQRLGLAVIQRNVRKFLLLRDWPWWKLYLKVQPLLSIARSEDEMKEKEEELKNALENAVANEAKKKELETQLTDIKTEKEKQFAELQAVSDRLVDTEDQLIQTKTLKDKLEASLSEAMERLEGEEHGATVLDEKIRNAEKSIEELTQKGEELSENISRLESEKASRDKQINSLNEDIAKQDEAIAKLGKEKKGVEDSLQERTGQLKAAEDKVSNLTKAKNKLEGTIKETEHSLQKEKDAKAKLDKEKHKVEGDLKDTKQKLSETEDELKNTQDTVAKREKAIKELEEVNETNENTIKQLQKKIQELLARIEELEEELENERKLRQKGELQRKELDYQLEELQEQLEVQGGATTAQVEVSKKREAECARLRKEIEEANAAAHAAAASAKVKFSAALAEAEEEAEALRKAKAKSDKEKSGLGNEVEELHAQLEQSKKQKVAADKANRALGEELAESRSKLSECESRLTDAEGKISKVSSEGSNISKSLEEVEHKLGLANKKNKALDAELEEATQQAEEESKAKHDLHLKLQGALRELNELHESLEDEQASKLELQNKLSKAGTQHVTGKLDEEGAKRVEELEDAKKKLATRVQEMEEALTAAESKAASMEKIKNRMNNEVEDLLLDLEKAQAQASNLEKKQKKVDQQINEWKLKCDEIQTELDKAQKDARTFSAEVLKLRGVNDNVLEKYEAMIKENKALAADLTSVSDQLSEGGRNSVELEKLRRKLGVENEQLLLALEETEAALEQEGAKLLKIQLAFAQLKQATDRQITEKDEELEHSRKNHHRQLESLQATINNEIKNKRELQQSRKNIESNIVELEGQLDIANRNSGEYQKNIKKLQAQIKELQVVIDDEGRERADTRDSISRAERRANELAEQLDEARVALDQTDRARKLAEHEKSEHVDRLANLQALYKYAILGKRKAEEDSHALQGEIEELESEAKSADDKTAKAMSEIARLTAELNSARESAMNTDKSRALLANQVADLQAQLEHAEAQGGKGLKNQIRNLEQRIMELEGDLDTEGRKSAEIVKAARKADKRVVEMQFQLENEQGANERIHDAAEKLNAKLKKMRLQLEEMEQQSAAWQSKYKKAAAELEESEHRSDAAQQQLRRMQQQSREATTTTTRTTSAVASRQRSRMRTPACHD